jgi:hypothetical protein
VAAKILNISSIRTINQSHTPVYLPEVADLLPRRFLHYGCREQLDYSYELELLILSHFNAVLSKKNSYA